MRWFVALAIVVCATGSARAGWMAVGPESRLRGGVLADRYGGPGAELREVVLAIFMPPRDPAEFAPDPGPAAAATPRASGALVGVICAVWRDARRHGALAECLELQAGPSDGPDLADISSNIPLGPGENVFSPGEGAPVVFTPIRGQPLGRGHPAGASPAVPDNLPLPDATPSVGDNWILPAAVWIALLLWVRRKDARAVS